MSNNKLNYEATICCPNCMVPLHLQISNMVTAKVDVLKIHRRFSGNPTIIKLGFPETVGELRKMLEPFDDNVSFGFRNQPIQHLMSVKYAGDSRMFVVFQELNLSQIKNQK